MKKFADNEKMAEVGGGGGEEMGQDFSMEELIMMKTMFLALETAVDEIDAIGGKTFPGSHIFEILAKAEVNISLYFIVFFSFCQSPWLYVDCAMT